MKSIRRQHLVEVRSLAHPPPAVRLAIESICVLLGETDLEWKSLRGIIMKDNFIPTIVNFKTDDIPYVYPVIICFSIHVLLSLPFSLIVEYSAGI